MPREVTHLAARWNQMFGLYPVTVRHVIDIALDCDRELLTVLDEVIPSFKEHPHPKKLGSWLRSNENVIIGADVDILYRFTRGVKPGTWQLRPVTSPALAA